LDPVQQQIGDGGFLSSRPCGPPCFWNITPGKSDRSQAEDELGARGIFEHCKSGSSASYDFEWISCGFALSVIFQKGNPVVYSITFQPYRTIRVRDAIRTLGSPKCVSVDEPLLPDHPVTYASLYYVDPRIVLDLEYVENFFAYSVGPRNVLIGIIYGPAKGSAPPQDCLEWRGYGEYPTPRSR
jgi:hypothetical protein